MLVAALVDKYDVDTASMENYWDIEPYLAAVQENEPDLIPHVIGPEGFWEHVIKFAGMERFDAVRFLGFRRDVGTIVPLNLYATPEYEEYCKVMQTWWDAGYINEDAPTGGNTSEKINAGKAGSIFNRNLILDTGTMGGLEYQNVKFGPAILNINAVLAHQTAVGRTSENPEKAVQLLELVRSNTELFRLLTYGIEDQHYTLDEDGRFTRVEGAGYNLVFDWPFGDAIHDGYRPASEDPTYLEKFEAALESAEPSMVLGFVFDPEPVAAELAQIQAILDQYEPQLSTGAGDWETVLPEFLDQLQRSGIDNVIAEMARQLEAWQASQ
jgi:putative aldouronate transport system substrate-binding protein